MPKSSYTTEDQTMYLMSGDKVVIESVIKNSKIPYCEAFDVRLKRVIESAGERKQLFMQILSKCQALYV